MSDRHLVSFLGTGCYQVTGYRLDEAGAVVETAHVALAIAELAAVDRVTLVASAEALAVHGQVVAAALAPRPVALREIPTGRNREELVRAFERLFAVFSEPCGELWVDVTHGFRTQPLLACACLSYLRQLGLAQGRPMRILYGRFLPEEPRISPIWDLSWLLELVDWAAAATLFVEGGRGDPLVRLLEEADRTLRAGLARRQAGDRWPRTRPVVRALSEYVADYQALRVQQLIAGEGAGRPGSARRLLDALEQFGEELSGHLPVAAPLLERVAEGLADLVAEDLADRDGLAALLALARRQYRQRRLLEAAAVAREGLVSLYAERAGATPGAAFDPQARRRAEAAWNAAERRAHRGHNPWSSARNDLLHAGYNRQPRKADALQKAVRSLLDHFAERLEQGVAQPAPRGRRILVTRHPGAVEWLRRRGLAPDRVVAHLDPAEVEAGDWVVGILPVHLAAAVVGRGARYFHLCLDLPEAARGRELSADELEACNARLAEFEVRAVEAEGDAPW
ncbi:MAG: hypothetical protein KatS3mg124_0324 [Porticoccaceae bacterium]|nr:MAG: hypothetical protein KatS3mg124_0324 [Porticoccaceae bacterium]